MAHGYARFPMEKYGRIVVKNSYFVLNLTALLSKLMSTNPKASLDQVLPENIVPTRYWHVLPDGRVQCDVCPRFCKLHEGQRGLCFVRANQNNKIVLTTYGRSSGYCVDPIEKKPLNHFLPGTPVLSFGTAGCNLACKFCQNWDISKSQEIDTLSDAATPETIAQAAQALGCTSVAYTYNDPTIFLEYAIDVADACHALGIKSVAVTAGYITDAPRREFYGHMDAANVDLKAFTEEFYWKITGAHLQPVLDTLVYLKRETKVWFELTTLLIPGLNDADQELEAMTQWVVENLGPDVPMHFTAFHPDWKMRDIPATPTSTLFRAREIAQRNGVRYAYTGNVHDEAGGSTYCHHCGAKLIGRDWYVITEWQLDAHGRCRACGTPCAGVFGAKPGVWGARRMPVRLANFV
jgi:pyruvate formate lyase activating enzyme